MSEVLMNNDRADLTVADAAAFDERVLAIDCQGERMFGILSMPAQVRGRPVLVVVGGPQYRVGSHRQFTLLARDLASQGIPVLRFDYRGMGDSGGAARDFDVVGDDLRAAVDALLASVPGAHDVVIWGLCDAASAAVFYAPGDARVAGLVLLNPWVRTEGGLAKATLKNYYRQRLLDPALWRKIASGQFNPGKALRSLVNLLGAARAKPAAAPAPVATSAVSVSTPALASAPARAATAAALPERMLASFSQYKGKVLLIMSGADLTAQEFTEAVKASRGWQRQLALARVTRHDLVEADHTFSRRGWRDQVASWTGAWVRTW
jgi:exosortase A-associated hydrolase 1